VDFELHHKFHFHGEKSVAQLKPVDTAGGHRILVLYFHGEKSVAQLKLRDFWLARLKEPSFPRRKIRGPIEASLLISMPRISLVISTEKNPWPN